MKSILSKCLVVAVGMACVLGVFGFQESDTYDEELALYNKADQETDQAQRRTLLLEFVRKYPESKLDQNVSYLYAQSYEGYRKGGQWQSMATAAERFLRHRPGDLSSIQAATEAYQKLGNPQKLADFGAQLYAQTPNVNTAYFVAKAYRSFNDHANFQKWGRRTLKHDPNNLEIMIELANSYWTTNNLSEAASYAKKALEAVGKAETPQGQSEEQWEARVNQIRAFCYRAIGEAAHSANNRVAARRNFEKSLQYDVRNDFVHYRLGFIYWAGGKIGPAMLSFAKAYVLNGRTSRDARAQLNQLYRSSRGRSGQLSVIIREARAAVQEKP